MNTLYIPSDRIKTTKGGASWTLGEYAHDTAMFGHLERGGLVATFDGVASFLSFLPEHMATAKRKGASEQKKERGFNEFASYEQTLKVYTNNPSSIRLFDVNDSRLTGGADSGLSLVHDVTGDMLDMGKYMSGEPECFSSLVNGKPRGKRVHIVINVGQSAGTTTEDLLTRSKRIVRLVDWLEAGNVRVQVTGIHANSCMYNQVTVKQYHEPLNLNDIAIVSHPDFPRRLGFRMIEYSKSYDSNYGSSRMFNEHVALNPDMLIPEDGNELSVFIGNDTYRMAYKCNKEFDKLEATLAQELADDIVTKPVSLGVLV